MNELYDSKSEGYYSGVRQSLIDLIPEGPNKIIELGCAKGYTLITARQAGKAAEIVGIDILTPEESHQRLDRYIKSESSDIVIDYPEDYFDVALCADVLEHLVNPWDAVRQLCRYLKPGGILIASLPNVRFYKTMMAIFLNGDFRYSEDGGILDNTHLRFFCKKNMRSLLTSAGLEVLSSHCKMSVAQRALTMLSGGLAEEFFVRQYTLVTRKP